MIRTWWARPGAVFAPRAGSLARRLTTPGAVALLAVVSVLASLLPADTLEAQEGPPPDTAPPIPLDPLTVTVLGTPVSTDRAPYAVTTVGEEHLRRGKTGAFLEEALKALPGLQVQNRFNYAVGERLAVRGSGSRAQFGVRGIEVLVDGIPATVADGQSTLDHVDIGTLGRVELLRGPASALYGNAAGGVLTFHTRSAFPGTFRQEVRATAGSHGLVNAEAVASGTLGDEGGTGWVASLARLDWDGFRDHPDRADETYGATDRVLFNGQLTHPLEGGLLKVTVNGVDLEAENPGSLAREAIDAGSRDAFGFNVAQRTRKDLTQGQLGASWSGSLPWGDAEVAAWGILRSVFNPIPPSVIDLSRRAGGLRGVLRTGRSTSFGSVRWGAGFEVELQHDERKNFDNDGGEAGPLLLDQLERVRATGAFVQGGVGIGEHLEATGALRYDRFRFEAEDDFTAGGDPDDSGERTMDQLSPSLGLVVDVSPALSLWGNVTTSLETPTTTELVNRPDGSGGFNPELDPQRATGLEAGARGRVGDAISWELAFFRTEVDDELVPFGVPEQPGRSFFRNAGASEHEGVEAVLRAAPGGGVSAQLAWTRVDARFEDFTVGGEDFAGNRVPGLAPNRIEGVFRQDRDGWYWAVDAEWVDEVPVNDEGTEAADSYTLVDLRAGLQELSVGGLTLSPFGGVSNLFDKRYTSAVTVNAFGGRYFEPGPGLGVHVGLTAAWSRR